jgi:hypothetical protein
MSQSLALLQAVADSVNNTRAEVIFVKSIAQKKGWRYGNAEICLLITRNPGSLRRGGSGRNVKDTRQLCVPFFPNFVYK